MLYKGFPRELKWCIKLKRPLDRFTRFVNSQAKPTTKFFSPFYFTKFPQLLRHTQKFLWIKEKENTCKLSSEMLHYCESWSDMNRTQKLIISLNPDMTTLKMYLLDQFLIWPWTTMHLNSNSNIYNIGQTKYSLQSKVWHLRTCSYFATMVSFFASLRMESSDSPCGQREKSTFRSKLW